VSKNRGREPDIDARKDLDAVHYPGIPQGLEYVIQPDGQVECAGLLDKAGRNVTKPSVKQQPHVRAVESCNVHAAVIDKLFETGTPPGGVFPGFAAKPGNKPC